MELHSKGRLLALPPIYKSKLEVTDSDKRSSLLLYEINVKKLYRTNFYLIYIASFTRLANEKHSSLFEKGEQTCFISLTPGPML